MKGRIGLCALLAGLIAGSATASAQSSSSTLGSADPRGAAELTICSQNLQNYGRYSDVRNRVAGMSEEAFREKEQALILRIIKAGCDVVAVQEVLGPDENISKIALESFAHKIRQRTNRFYEVRVGASNDPSTRLGFLVAQDRAEVLNLVSYVRTELPKLTEKERTRLFSRGPLEIQLKVKGRDGTFDKTVSLVNFHLKSKSGGQLDSAGLEFETYRMQMAEAIRRVVEARHGQSFALGETILAVLGDRNSNFDEASAKILDGVLTLKHFRAGGPCRLSKRGVPLCQPGAAMPQKLFSVLVNDPETKLNPGTHQYKKEYSWLDEIAMPAESLRFAWKRFDSHGDYDSGVIYEPRKASDHAMVYVRLNW